MRVSSLLVLSTTALVGACASSSRGMGGSSTPTPAPAPATGAPTAAATPAPSGAPAWQGEFQSQNGVSLAGTVAVNPTADGQTLVTVALTRAPGAGDYPWHVHTGSCTEQGSIVGDPSAYPRLAADSSGTARAEFTLPYATPSTGSYSVFVHRSPTQMGMIIGCADLRPR